MRRVLMVCYHFPPLGGIASLRALRFARHLPEFGWEPLVLVPEQPAGARDTVLTFDQVHVVRSTNFEWTGAGARMGGDAPGLHGASAAGVRGRLRAFARRWLYFPDGHVGWYPGAVRAGPRVVGESPIY
jgi:hypothetical protein